MGNSVMVIDGTCMLDVAWGPALAEKGLQGTRVVYADDALLYIKDQAYDAIVLEPRISPRNECRHGELEAMARMGVKDPLEFGIKILEVTRNGSANRGTPVCIYTGCDPKHDDFLPNAGNFFLGKGADYFFYKPKISLSEIVEHLAQVLNGKM